MFDRILMSVILYFNIGNIIQLYGAAFGLLLIGKVKNCDCYKWRKLSELCFKVLQGFFSSMNLILIELYQNRTDKFFFIIKLCFIFLLLSNCFVHWNSAPLTFNCSIIKKRSSIWNLYLNWQMKINFFYIFLTNKITFI